MSLLLWYLILFVPQLVIGAAVGWWACRHTGSPAAGEDEPAVDAEAVSRKQKDLRDAMSRLQQLTDSVKDDVREHAFKVDSGNRSLVAVKEAGGDADAALAALAPILEANEQLQQRLAEAEKKLADQSQQLCQQTAEARTDPLTGLVNRRGLEEKLADLLQRNEQNDEPFSLVILDVDHFKKFNDTYGHDVGDVVLRDVARVGSGAVRTNDLLGRYGGEEFVALLPKTDLHQARQVAEQIRSAIESHTIEDEAEELHVTVSLGVAQAVVEDIAALLKRADVALYAAKENGRNCAWYHDGLDCKPVARLSRTAGDARSDELTELPSRRAFTEEAGRRVAEAARAESELSVIALEIDQIQQISATNGEAIANLVLRGMARFLSDLMRDMDLVARNGETGFAVLLPGCALSDASRVAERVRGAVANSPFPAEEDELPLTISAGVVTAEPHEPAEDLLNRAERALSWCAASNGDCIYVDDGQSDPAPAEAAPQPHTETASPLAV